MKKLSSHSRSSLFLMEMIIASLFLSLMCSICVQVFVKSYFIQKEARALNHIQTLIISSGEILEGTDGSAKSFASLLPDGIVSNESITYYFDSKWESCDPSISAFVFSIDFQKNSLEKTAFLSFKDSSGKMIQELMLRFPVKQASKEVP